MTDARSGRPAGGRHPAIGALACGLAALWTAVGIWRALGGHASLASNAFDLSVFDYAVRDLAAGGRGVVPFLGFSIFSHHFMPVLYALAPLHLIRPTAATLIVVQRLAMGVAAMLFYGVARRLGVTAVGALGLMVTFLMARRTHSAFSGFFYPEAFQPALTFAMIWLAHSTPWRYWPVVIALLATKEDAAIYVAGFGLLSAVQARSLRLRGGKTFALAVVWFIAALTLAIPASRTADGLGSSNPLIDARFGAPDGTLDAVELGTRAASSRTLRTAADLLLSTGLLPLFGWTWLGPALPGFLINTAASPGTMQSGLAGHYALPVLPWLFVAAATGAAWLLARRPHIAAVWIAALAVASAADNPALRRLRPSSDPPAVARDVQNLIPDLADRSVLAQANLIPHLPYPGTVYAVGGDLQPPAPAEIVLLTPHGDTWPLDKQGIEDLIASYRNDPRYQLRTGGPLFVFERYERGEAQ